MEVSPALRRLQWQALRCTPGKGAAVQALAAAPLVGSSGGGGGDVPQAGVSGINGAEVRTAVGRQPQPQLCCDVLSVRQVQWRAFAARAALVLPAHRWRGTTCWTACPAPCRPSLSRTSSLTPCPCTSSSRTRSEWWWWCAEGALHGRAKQPHTAVAVPATAVRAPTTMSRLGWAKELAVGEVVWRTHLPRRTLPCFVLFRIPAGEGG